MKIQLESDNINGWKINYLKLSNGEIIIQNIIHGEIMNSVVNKNRKDDLLLWKQTIAKIIFSKRNIKLDSSNIFAISLSFKFHSFYHGNRNLDVENYIKPILDGIAAGLFCDDTTNPLSITSFNYDDSNFRHLFIERLEDPTTSTDEGVSITISKK